MLVETVYRPSTGWEGLSVYRDVFGQPEIRKALLNTVYMVIGSTALAVIMGTTLAWMTSSVNVPLARYLNIVPILPMFLPPLIGAVGWEFLLSPGPGLLNVALRAIIPGNQTTGPLSIYNLWGIAWVNSLYVTPYVYLNVISAFRRYDTSLDEVARVAGSSTFKILRRISFPLLRPAIITGTILAFVISIGDFSVPLILGEPNQIPVLTTQIYNELSNYPQNVQAAAALSLLTIALTVIALYLQRRWLRGTGRFVTVGGRGVRHRETHLGGTGRWALFGILLLYVLLVVVAPILAILNVSLRPFWTASDLGASNLTWANYRLVMRDPIAIPSIENSLKLALIGATIGIAIAILIGYTVQRSRIRGRGILDYAATIPIAVPGTVFGASLLIFFLDGPIVLYGTTALLLIAYIAYYLPQGVRTVTASLVQSSTELEEAAMVCGSGWLGAMRRVTLPIIRPAIASGWIFLFVLMSREVAMSALLANAGTNVMSVEVISLWANGPLPELAAFSVIVLLISACLTFVAQFIGNRGRI